MLSRPRAYYRSIRLLIGLAPTFSLMGPGSPGTCTAGEPQLAPYFGFDAMEIMVVDDRFGPIAIADLNGDGLNDIAVANNRKSRIELLYQRRDPSEAALEIEQYDVNELPPLWRFRREKVSVTHRVSALAIRDFNEDGLADLVYAGQPDELVLMDQTSRGVFEIAARQRLRNLSSDEHGLAVADLRGDGRLEVAALAGQSIHIITVAESGFVESRVLEVGREAKSVMVGEFTGTGQADLLAYIPEDRAPIRVWVRQESADGAELGAQTRFDLPALRDLTSIHVPDLDRTALAMIERASRRIVISQMERSGAERKKGDAAALDVFAFPASAGDHPDVAVADVDADGLPDVVVTDAGSNAILLYLQIPGQGFGAPQSFPSLAEPEAVAVGNVDDEDAAELFVMSTEETVLGRSDWRGRGFDFPRPLATEDELVAIELVDLDGPRLAVLTKDKRDHSIRMFDAAGDYFDVELGSMSRSPESMIAWDADQDGKRDLLLLSSNAPMVMLHRESDGSFKTMTEDDMGQYGLVQEARSANTTIMDIDGDGLDELLLADRNYVRALRYDPRAGGGSSPGWQVVEQFNLSDSSSKLVSLTVFDDQIVVLDDGNDRLVLMSRGPLSWIEDDSIIVRGFDFDSIFAGSFTGDDQRGLLGVGEDGFAVVRLSGDRLGLTEIASWRTDDEDRLEHELASGDINGDGFMDLIALDAGEQMLEVFTLTEARRMLHAVEFEVFQTKIFSGGESREFEPRQAFVVDLTGDDADDLLVVIHDRMLLYPQRTGQ